MTSITLTPVSSAAPAPYVQILLGSIDAGVASVTVWRTSRSRERRVRGLINVSATGTVSALDFEAPPELTISYRAQQFDSSGNFVSWTAPVTVVLPSFGTNVAWIHNPIDPTTSVQVIMAEGAGSKLVRPTNSQALQSQGRSAGVAMFGVRGALNGVVLDCYTTTESDADRFDALFGGYDDSSTVPILCIRTPAAMRLPGPLFALVGSPSQNPVDFFEGGTWTSWGLTGDEISPPPEAVIIALLSYADFTAFFSTYAAFTSHYSDYQAATTDYTIAGTA